MKIPIRRPDPAGANIAARKPQRSPTLRAFRLLTPLAATQVFQLRTSFGKHWLARKLQPSTWVTPLARSFRLGDFHHSHGSANFHSLMNPLISRVFSQFHLRGTSPAKVTAAQTQTVCL